MRTLPRGSAGALALLLGCEANNVQVLGVAPDYQRPDGGAKGVYPGDSEPVGTPLVPLLCSEPGGRRWQAQPLVQLKDESCLGCFTNEQRQGRMFAGDDGSVWLFEPYGLSRSAALHMAANGELLGLRADGDWRVSSRAMSGDNLYTYEVLSLEDGSTRAVLRVFDAALDEVAGPFVAPGAQYGQQRAEEDESVRLAPHPDGVMMLRVRAFRAEVTVLDAALRVIDGWSTTLSGHPSVFDQEIVLGRTPETEVPAEVVLDTFQVGRVEGARLGVRSAGLAGDKLSLARGSDGRIVTSGLVAREEVDYPLPDRSRCAAADCPIDPFLWVMRLGIRNTPEYLWRVHARIDTLPAVHPDGRVLVPSFSTGYPGDNWYIAEIAADGSTCTRSELETPVSSLAIAADGTIFYATGAEVGVLVEGAP